MRKRDRLLLLGKAKKEGGKLHIFWNVEEGEREVERSRETLVGGGGREGDCISPEE